MKKLLLLLFLASTITAYSQTDSLILSNNDVIVGEIKSMDKGVLIIETDYSDSDFKISWSGVRRIASKTKFLITLSTGKRYNGRINSVDSLHAMIDTYDPQELLNISLRKKKENENLEKPLGGKVQVDLQQVVYLNALDEGFWSRLSANIDFGWSLTKANNLKQLNVRSGVGYLADRWKLGSSFNSLRSNQDRVESVKRTDGDITFNFFLPKDYFLLYNITFLSNTEQLIRLRTVNKVGIGKYVAHTNKTYFGFQTGFNFNNEAYFDDTPNRRSGEAFIGSELNLYDIGDLNLLTQLVAYPSLSEKGRFRTDFKVDLKYDFPKDIYIKIGTTMNYDNRPIEGATKLDYIIQTTVGWSL
jgi:putative salt-induced outer membrane protein YdiY/small nuclear ribonucleoprotein (snRNP)-like protein